MKNPSLMPEKFKGKKTDKAGVAVEEEYLLSFIDVCDDNVILDTGASMMYMQVDIHEAYRFSTIDYGFVNVTDKDDIPDLDAPTVNMRTKRKCLS